MSGEMTGNRESGGIGDSTAKAASAKPPAFEYVVERGKIREFAAAMQSDSADYQSKDAVIPPTFLATSSFWAPEGSRPDVGFDRKRLLHGEQEYIFHGPPPRAGDVMQATSFIADRYEKAGKRGGTMRFAVVVTEFRDGNGALRAEQRTTLVETAKPPKEDA
jgi:hypothetical protein